MDRQIVALSGREKRFGESTLCNRMYARRSVGVCSGRMAFSLPTNIHISISVSVDDTTLRVVCNFVFLDGEQP